ncbi:DnaJ-domain-containing protein [Ascobolus immersus RN42]|uniref:DnaJ-domain-containing protein n=1 Tax=Ascobolus immersus RN42 TaxID=1160509 RepID=A0A3N4HI53_ASCIM|nr:DnaJ-domain-containing protein [Ascobolus immersus RN42]
MSTPSITIEKVNKISEPRIINVEPIGPAWLAETRRKIHQRTMSEDERVEAEKKAAAMKTIDEDDSEDEEEDPQMLLREAKDWKQQDHYAVMGLSKYRFRATDEQIKKAYRKKVLKHHPDKRAASGAHEGDAFFKCIQKAMEILTDPVKRRQWDSVDENADVEPPSRKAKNFSYKQWGKVFEAEGRFSKKQPVPKLGDENSSKADVDAFYNFFYNFDSWRTFEYLDEDVPDDTESRDQRRHVERKNKAARVRRKNEDNARLRKLVDDCLNLDPRIKKFKDEERNRKNAKKNAREAEEKKAAEEAARKAEEEKKAAEEAAAAAAASKMDSKKAKEAAKNAAKKNKRAWRDAVKSGNYFVEGDASADAITHALADIEVLIAKADNETLASVAKELEGVKGKSAETKAKLEEVAKKLAVPAGELKVLSV